MISVCISRIVDTGCLGIAVSEDDVDVLAVDLAIAVDIAARFTLGGLAIAGRGLRLLRAIRNHDQKTSDRQTARLEEQRPHSLVAPSLHQS
jgi:hypothetical protein